MAKILLVEDDKSLREIYGVRLMAEGYEIVSAGDGEEALAMAIKERPELIVSDVMMPKISGFDMLDILRSTTETKNVKVIMMTALSSEDQRARGEALGADRYLVKSQVGIEDVVRTVHDVLGDGLPGAAPATPVAAAAPAYVPEPTPTPAPVATTIAPSEPLPVAPAPAAPIDAPVIPTPAPAPVVDPTTPLITFPTAPEPIATPVAPLAAAPAPTAAPVEVPTFTPQPVAVAPIAPAAPFAPVEPAPQATPAPYQAPSSLPQPIAPFSTPMPTSDAPTPVTTPTAAGGERVISPLNDLSPQTTNIPDLSSQIEQALNSPSFPSNSNTPPAL